jgi:hypothetical protein
MNVQAVPSSHSNRFILPRYAQESPVRHVQFAQEPAHDAVTHGRPSGGRRPFDGIIDRPLAEPKRRSCVPIAHWNTKQACYVGLGVAGLVGVIVGSVYGVRRQHAVDAHPVAFNETFATLDPDLWTVSNGTRNEGAFYCGFTQDAVKTGPNGLTLSVIPGDYVRRDYGCAQIISTQTYTYGTFSASMRASPQPGVVTALFTYVESKPELNQEIDIEMTGANNTAVWVTSYRDAKVTTELVPLPYNVSTETHVYAFDWRKNFIAWSIDGKEILRQTEDLPKAVPTKLFMSTWLREPSDFGGQFDPKVTQPVSSSHFDWVAFEP